MDIKVNIDQMTTFMTRLHSASVLEHHPEMQNVLLNEAADAFVNAVSSEGLKVLVAKIREHSDL